MPGACLAGIKTCGHEPAVARRYSSSGDCPATERRPPSPLLCSRVGATLHRRIRPQLARRSRRHDIQPMDTSSEPTFASHTPVRIGAVALAVRDLDRMLAYYRDAIGLDVLAREHGSAVLGAGGVPFLTLEHRPQARPDDGRGAGLFHTAFLMPTRADLARFVLHIASRRVAVTGVADHHVSEAIYLDDPEGNGVEVYADRPAAEWRRDGAKIEITTEPLDMNGLIDTARVDPRYHQAPAGLRIGHVHLRVGDVASAERFYGETLGFDVTWRVPGAAFLSSGGYHHHLATNVWRSAGAGRRDDDRAGLARLTLEAERESYQSMVRGLDTAGLDRAELRDPWGTRIVIAAA